MRLANLLAPLVGLGVTLASPAHATGPTDTEFLHTLDQAQITYTSPDAAISYAQRVCQALDDDKPDKDILSLMISDNPTLLEWQAGAFLGASVAAYCPQHNR
ncbi:DUF732 domain-containing protein [Mycobacterium talmoniae]|uniref:DUF732 domain-containing protein n=1 Tax=Mycobacterium talmoniae TaxID=1858794 RepID=A0A2S8BG47_9MYCO|nr:MULTISPECIES: DUF732 domain-containing protein [Mycobacterium]PQM45599.1 hypothetical protein C1Y40_04246 [Mycobacterium talmoniae]TDH49615.1 DUF732 domain-containing protein [Mycobacterium eburneum]